MRGVFFVAALLLIGLMGQSQEAWTDKTRVLPDALRKVPEAIFVRHSPNPNYPEKVADNESEYVWKHSTTVICPELDLEVIEAGSYIWYSEQGWVKNVDLSKSDFAKKFHCPKGVLEKGQRYTFEKNYRYGSQLYGGDALWYVMAKASDGTIYKGFAILETEAEIKKQ